MSWGQWHALLQTPYGGEWKCQGRAAFSRDHQQANPRGFDCISVPFGSVHRAGWAISNWVLCTLVASWIEKAVWGELRAGCQFKWAGSKPLDVDFFIQGWESQLIPSADTKGRWCKMALETQGHDQAKEIAALSPDCTRSNCVQGTSSYSFPPHWALLSHSHVKHRWGSVRVLICKNFSSFTEKFT